MARYYILDTSDTLTTRNFQELLNKEEFLSSLTYNYWVAKNYGDDLEDLKKILKEFNHKQNVDEEINGFIYCKLTNKTLEEFYDL